MNLKPTLLSCLLALPWSAAGASCPWRQALELLHLDSDEQIPERRLSAEQVAEDIACVQLMLEHYYVAQSSVPDSPILHRLQTYSVPSDGLIARDFLRVLFGFHTEVYDVHMGYLLRPLVERHGSRQPVRVTVSEELPLDTVVQRADYTYFRVGSLKNAELTPGQAEFIAYLRHHDSPIVLDLRGNPGGDNVFAEAAARALHTPAEHIPQHRFEQVASFFTRAGLLNHLRVLEYDNIAEYEAMVIAGLQDRTVADVLPFTWEIDSTLLLGERDQAFTSKIIILMDGYCASACETIVEKLALHPNVRTVGQATYGALHFGNAMLFQLPHSGIWAKLPTAREVMEHDAPEGEGYRPDTAVTHIELDQLFTINAQFNRRRR